MDSSEEYYHDSTELIAKLAADMTVFSATTDNGPPGYPTWVDTYLTAGSLYLDADSVIQMNRGNHHNNTAQSIVMLQRAAALLIERQIPEWANRIHDKIEKLKEEASIPEPDDEGLAIYKTFDDGEGIPLSFLSTDRTW